MQTYCKREKCLYLDYLTVNGSGSFHGMVFKPKATTFHASSQLSVCDNCLHLNFEACPSFRIYETQVAKLNEKATRSKAASMVKEQSSKQSFRYGNKRFHLFCEQTILLTIISF